MQSTATSLIGESKESVDHSQSKKSSRGCRQKQKQNNNPKQQPKTQNQKHQQSPHDNGRALARKGSLCADELKKDLAESKHTTNQTSQQDRGEGAKKQPISSAETQDPPSQDPGDRTVKPTGHEAPSNACDGRAMN